jgi:hypothetical protein
VVSTAIIGMLVTALVGGAIYGGQSSVNAGNRQRAVLLAEEGLEAARNLRAENFSKLTDGTHGLSLASGQWALSGSSDTNGIYTRTLTIATASPGVKLVTSAITWPQPGRPLGRVSLATNLGDLALLNQQASSLTINTGSWNVGGSGQRELRGLTLGNSGGAAIVVDKVTVAWTNAGRSLNEIQVNGTIVWSGTEGSGTLVDVQNFTVAPGTLAMSLNRLWFSGNMQSPGNTFVITFTLVDGSTKSVSLP